MTKLYYSTHFLSVIKKGTYKNYNWIITSCGWHPCAYVEIPKGDRLYELDYTDTDMDSIDCHGGVTFTDYRDFGFGKKYYLGWDYAHLGDYSAMPFGDRPLYMPNEPNAKKWTIKEIKTEIQSVIKQIKEINSL